MSHAVIDVEALCADKGLRITEQRRVIARILSESEDHPDVETLHERAAAIDPKISIATVYRTVRLFEEAGILARHEFVDEELEALQKRIAEKLGFRLVDHRMELYGVSLNRNR
jgi:Fur family ferric uptake transcriptional regulator